MTGGESKLLQGQQGEASSIPGPHLLLLSLRPRTFGTGQVCMGTDEEVLGDPSQGGGDEYTSGGATPYARDSQSLTPWFLCCLLSMAPHPGVVSSEDTAVPET